MRTVIDVDWDAEAGVWYAQARGSVGLVTEAPTLDSLRDRVALMLADLSEEDSTVGRDFDLVVHSVSRLIAAE